MPISRLITNLLWIPILIGSVWAAVAHLELSRWLSVPVGLCAGMVLVLALAAATSAIFPGSNTQ